MDFLKFLSEVGTNALIHGIVAKNSLLISGMPVAVGLVLKAFAILGPKTKDNKISTILRGVVSRKGEEK